MQSFDINCAAPDQLPRILRQAAQAYRESRIDLQSTWQDHSAGLVWDKLAAILDRAFCAGGEL